MSSLWTDLLFLHGYITDLRLAQRLTDAPPRRPRGAEPRPRWRPAVLRWPARLCLGIGDGSLRSQ